MNAPRKTLADWLRDAHAMESNLITMLDRQHSSLADYPELQRRIAAHSQESRSHADRVEQCLKSLGEDTSILKEGFAKLSGMIAPLGAAMASDTAVKIVLANTASEHFEIACYTSLQAAALHFGEITIAGVAKDILGEEQDMVNFLEGQIEAVTVAHLERP